MNELAMKIDGIIRSNSEVRLTTLTVGQTEPNVAELYVSLTPFKTRKLNTSGVKQKIRDQLKEYAYANVKVKDFDGVGAGQRPFNLNIIGTDPKELERVARLVFDKVKNNPALKDVDINYRPGKPEFQVVPEQRKMELLGISSIGLGQELRAQVEGVKAAKFRQDGIEYDVRVRLKEDQRNLKNDFNEIYVPNINYNLVRLRDLAKPVETDGPAKITRQDRGRYVQINADVAPGGGLGDVMGQINTMFKEEIKLPQGMRYAFVGQAENFQELGESMLLAMGLGLLFIFMVLASLYESFVTPFTIMLALPLAVCGSFFALFVTRESLNLFSMIGTIMLLGVSTKNSILLVDYANQLIAEGMDRGEAMIKAGRTRLRPILMTTLALIAGTLPIALGLNEASRQRTSMGVAIIGGLISSTLLTLVVVPAAFSFIDRFRVWSKLKMGKLVGVSSVEATEKGKGSSNGRSKDGASAHA
jgi:HAE1 family hydrophobic/amphiphilic exporter-1